MGDIPYKHIDANYIDDTYMLHNESSVYAEPNPILPIGAIFILICSSICCSYQSGNYYMSDLLNRTSSNNNNINESIIKSDRLKYYEYDTTIIDEFNKECCICLDKFEEKDKTVILDCNHRFHTNCILNWFKKELNCPLCRKNADIL
uniref:RING-type domain-containing protein n=1 Tax=viral metagenome TaxID=1070528 RepID=A0A6C0CFN8_9ZZZZ